MQGERIISWESSTFSCDFDLTSLQDILGVNERGVAVVPYETRFQGGGCRGGSIGPLPSRLKRGRSGMRGVRGAGVRSCSPSTTVKVLFRVRMAHWQHYSA